jgi:exonuclease SbcC
MIPVRLEIRNFLAYRSPDAVRFEGIHLACLTGPNGAGKSSLLDAVTWALWGRARGKRDDELVHIGQSDMHVQLDFEQEGIVYRVIRKRSKRQKGVGALDLFSQVDNQWVTQSEPSIRDTQDKINRLLRLDYETFVHSAFLQQGKADAFTTKAPAQRKQILADILGLAQWEAYEELAKEQLRQITNELNVIDVRVQEIENELAKEPRLQALVVEAETAQKEAQTALDAAEKKLEEVAHAPSSMRAAQERLADCQRRVKEYDGDLKNIAQDILRHQDRIAQFQSIIAAKDDIEQGYAVLQAARQADSALGDKLMRLSDFDTQRHELENRLRDARAELENECSGYTARIAELERAVQNANPDDLAGVQVDVANLQALDAERKALDEAMRAMSEERANLSGALEQIEAEGKTLNKRLAELKNTTSATCPLCGQPLDEQHRMELLAELEADVSRRREDYRNSKDRIAAIGGEVKTRKDRIAQLDVELRRLEPLMKRAGELQAQLDAANTASARLDTERAGLEAVQTLLDNESFALEIREQLSALDQQRAEIGYDRASHDNARQQLNTYQDYDVRQKELEIALSGLPDAQAALEAAGLRRERTERARADEQAAVEALGVEMKQLEVLVREQQVRQQEVNRLRTVERQQYQRLVNAQQELKTMDRLRERRAELEKRRMARRHDEALYKELRDAFGKNGVPAMIIEAAIPELESEANRLLSRMTDGRMSLSITTQREKTTGEGVIETLDIQIADELGTRSYEMYSGGEAFRINFAIRVALSQLLSRRAGAHLRTLFIDEGFGTQDEDGRTKLVEAIVAVQEDFDLILVITHIDDLRDSFPVHVVVQKTPGGSRVSVR